MGSRLQEDVADTSDGSEAAGRRRHKGLDAGTEQLPTTKVDIPSQKTTRKIQPYQGPAVKRERLVLRAAVPAMQRQERPKQPQRAGGLQDARQCSILPCCLCCSQLTATRYATKTSVSMSRGLVQVLDLQWLRVVQAGVSATTLPSRAFLPARTFLPPGPAPCLAPFPGHLYE